MYTEYLYHSGIKGMKWGVRRFQNPDGTWTEAGKARYGRKAAKEIRKAEKKARKQAVKKLRKANRDRRIMSDEELEYAIKRLEKERRFKDLTDKEINEGRQYTKELLKDIGKKTVPLVVSTAALYSLGIATNNRGFEAGKLADDVYSLYKSSMKKK